MNTYKIHWSTCKCSILHYYTIRFNKGNQSGRNIFFPAFSNLQVEPMFIPTALWGSPLLNGLIIKPSLCYGSHCYSKFAVIS